MHGYRAVVKAAGVALLFAGCAVPSGGFSGQGVEPSNRRFVNPGTMAQLDGFTHAVRIGFVTYVSGEVPLDSAGHLVGAGDLAAQAKQAFANLDLVLRIAGNVPSDVVKLTVYVVNYHPQDLAVIRQAAPEYFTDKNPPTGLVLGVQALPQEGMLIAVDAIAQAPAMFRPRAGAP
jgi:enamine deaminase RidA (YjgF/YER057c/UK114 family)